MTSRTGAGNAGGTQKHVALACIHEEEAMDEAEI